jgi:holo-[acyl-carrier protein] synthase
MASASFMHRVFTPLELAGAAQRAEQAVYYTQIFAAKEAVFKCFGMSAEELRSWLEIEVSDSGEAQPTVRLTGSMAEVARARKVERVALSLSSETDHAVAFAVVECADAG